MSLSELTAGDVMKQPVITLQKTDSLAAAVQTLSDEDISGAPVYSRQALVGTLSLRDLANFLAGLERPLDLSGAFMSRGALEWSSESESDSNLPDVSEDVLGEATVGDAMNDDIVTCRRDAPLPELIRIIHQQRVPIVLVQEDRLLGVVTATDILGRVLLETVASSHAGASTSGR